MATNECDVTVVIVSYNTKEMLRDCLDVVDRDRAGLSIEVIVVDNASRDGSPEMVAQEFPSVKLISSKTNLGFAAANNKAFAVAQGRYIVLLNSDAFCQLGAMKLALDQMKADPSIGVGGGRLVGSDGSWQPSARMFPSVINDFLCMSGLSAKYPNQTQRL